MRRESRSIVVAVLSALLFMNPAIACHNCGGGYSGGYGGYGYSDYGYASYGYGGYDYDGYYGSSCCGGGVVVESGCGCDGCTDCGCDGCAGCGGGEEVMYGESSESYGETHTPTTAPEPPAYEPPTTMSHEPSVAPVLPPAPMPSEHTTEMHEMPPAMPAEAPAAETAPAESMPVPPPVAETSTDDLFAAPAAETTPPAAAAAGDDLFGPAEPAAETTPAAETPTTEPAGDDLFGPPAEEAPPVEEAPAEETPPAEDDDLFGDAGSILRQPGGLASVELRRWMDNTGRHSCRGRLIKMLDGKVQLLKDTGRTTTVALGRLSPEDLAFVHRQASAQRSEAMGQTAQADASW